MRRTRQTLRAIGLIVTIGLLAMGCRSSKKPYIQTSNIEPISQLRTITYPDLTTESRPDRRYISPRTSLTELTENFRELTLDEAIMIALQDTQVLRSLGATAVSNPQFATSSLDPAIQSTDPNFGIQAALAQFDARFNSNMQYAKNDDVFNNAIFGGGARETREDLTSGSTTLSKTNAFGTQYSIGTNFQHSQSNAPNLLFPHAWTTVMEATVRQPLMQGRGVQFNRVAGPTAQPGFRNSTGIIISRINHDISIAQFEVGVRDMLSEIIDAYWQLDFAYKSFESIRTVRDLSLSTWNMAKARYDSDLNGGEADRESQAREQYYEFQAQLMAALNGNTQTGQVGVLQAEANLRRLLKLPQSDDLLLKPSDEPALVHTLFSWNDLADLTIESRAEVREQLWRVKQRQLELAAAHNFLLPRLDAFATYRNNGFGDDLAGGGGRFSSALSDAVSNDHGEWELGVTYDATLGFRQAHAGVRNAELALQRERAILREQEDQILHDLGSAIRAVDQNYLDIELQFNRMEAARNTVEARTAAFEADTVGFDELLDAQQRLLQSELAFYRSASGYEQAKANLMKESGRLLAAFDVNMMEEDPTLESPQN